MSAVLHSPTVARRIDEARKDLAAARAAPVDAWAEHFGRMRAHVALLTESLEQTSADLAAARMKEAA